MDGPRTVAEIVAVSEGPRAEERPGDVRARAGGRRRRRGDAQAALEALPRVARTGTHLFQFARSSRASAAGAARFAARSAAGTPAPPETLAYQAVKYRQREG